MGIVSESCIKKYYVGVRSSEITFSKHYFDNQICLFSSKEEENEYFTIRPNQNIGSNEISSYYNKKINEAIHSNDNARLIFYNQANAYNYSAEILDKCLFINSRDILEFLNNKITIKKWFLNCGIPIIPYETYLGENISYSHLLLHYPNVESFVVQKTHGGGGIGTFLFESNSHIPLTDSLIKNQQYMVSPYLNNSISANTHVFISEKNCIISPGSIQIIELHHNQLCYRGADYIEFRRLPFIIKSKIKQLSIKICDLLRAKGYYGVAGIDFIIDQSQQVFCSEINPRFQASSILLDHFLSQSNLTTKSIFELNELAFSNNLISDLCFEDEIDLSCYYYYANDISGDYIERRYQIIREAGGKVFLDGLESYLPHRFNSNSYLFCSIFPHSISKSSPDMTLWISDNIALTSKPKDRLALKIALLNQGIRLNVQHNDIKRGVYESIDIEVQPCQTTNGKSLLVNCPLGIYLSIYSPYEIKYIDQDYELFYYSEKIADIKIEIDRLKILSEVAKHILYLATDRLRVKLISGCEYKNINKSCQFCNLPLSAHRFSLKEIGSALDELLENNIDFQHILIGGGTCLAPHIWDDICSLSKMIKSKIFLKDKAISLMSVLPPINVLQKLKDAGIDEVAFNLEIANDNLANEFMPGKRQSSKEDYYKIFQRALLIFGSKNVRSALIVGFDCEDELMAEITNLANLGVLPCLSVFRALPGSVFENDLGPDNKYCRRIYEKAANEISRESSGEILELGPKCCSCRNNMLGL